LPACWQTKRLAGMDKSKKEKEIPDYKALVPSSIGYILIFLVSSFFIITKPNLFAFPANGDWLDQLKTVALLLSGVVLVFNALLRIRSKVTQGDALLADYGVVIFGVLTYDCLLYKYIYWYFFIR
jgi:hypothetical protein